MSAKIKTKQTKQTKQTKSNIQETNIEDYKNSLSENPQRLYARPKGRNHFGKI